MYPGLRVILMGVNVQSVVVTKVYHIVSIALIAILPLAWSTTSLVVSGEKRPRGVYIYSTPHILRLLSACLALEGGTEFSGSSVLHSTSSSEWRWPEQVARTEPE